MRLTRLKLVLLVLGFGLFCLPGWAALSDDPLAALESRLWSRTYPQESTEARLARIEQNVFGSSVKGKTETQRIEAIENLIPVVPQTPRRPSGGKAPVAQDPSDVRSAFENPREPSRDDSEYPAISALEQKVFGEPSPNLPVEARLDQLELKVLGRMQRGSLQERTDQLRMTVLGDTDGGMGAAPEATGLEDGALTVETPSSAASSSLSASERADLEQALMTTENRLLRQTYPGDSLENRLSRLEMRLFNQTASEMPPQDRLYRIAGVMSAQKSAKSEQVLGGTPGRGPGGAMTFGNIILMLLMSLL